MKSLILAATIAFAGISGEAMADCAGGTRISSVATLIGVLSGNTVCVPTPTVSNMTWQELHATGNPGGALIDFKRGPVDPIDPSETVGTWTVTGNAGGNSAVVTHNYGTGGSFTYEVHDNGNGTHSFCSGNPEIVGKIKPGGGAC